MWGKWGHRSLVPWGMHLRVNCVAKFLCCLSRQNWYFICITFGNIEGLITPGQLQVFKLMSMFVFHTKIFKPVLAVTLLAADFAQQSLDCSHPLTTYWRRCHKCHFRQLTHWLAEGSRAPGRLRHDNVGAAWTENCRKGRESCCAPLWLAVVSAAV